jgi:HK97 gp10 family phage protein
MAEFLRVEGLSELLEGLDELSKATATNVLKRALNKAADPIQTAAEAAAPVLTGKLQRSITIGTKLSRRQRSLYQKRSKVEVFVGPGALAQATAQEFGTVTNRPQPFMRPAFLSNWRKSLDLIREELANEIEKARQRAMRKAARVLSQMKG